jgi:hypothetical protein
VIELIQKVITRVKTLLLVQYVPGEKGVTLDTVIELLQKVIKVEDALTGTICTWRERRYSGHCARASLEGNQC